jgi:hypothetical protein
MRNAVKPRECTFRIPTSPRELRARFAAMNEPTASAEASAAAGGTVDRLAAARAATLTLTRAPRHAPLSIGTIAGENVAESPSNCIVLAAGQLTRDQVWPNRN